MSTSKWERALVTGASAGIGETVARRLAKAGTALVVVARRRDRLEDLAGELVDGTGTEVEVLAADLIDDAGIEAVTRRVASTASPIDLVVNNAGFTTSGRFVDLPIDSEIDMITLNVTALVRITHAAAEAMVSRGSGSIVNISSMGSFQPMPSFATYAGTKAFVTNFTESIHEELKGTGVAATVVCPSFTHTEFAHAAGLDEEETMYPDFIWMTADQVAEEVIEAASQGVALRVPGLKNRVLAAATAPIPRGLKRWFVGEIARRRPNRE